MVILEYFWYRIARVYYKWDSDGITASAFLALTESIFVLDLVGTILKFIDRSGILMGENNSYVFVGFNLVLLTYNYFRFRERYWRLRDRWIDEPKGLPYFLKGVGVLLLLILPWVWLVVMIKFGR